MPHNPTPSVEPVREPLLITDAPCPSSFYAFGASYPDGYCHDGHLDDADDDCCRVDYDYRPCPYCKPAEYQAQLRDRGFFMPPFGYERVVRGDYFSYQTRNKKKLARRDAIRREAARRNESSAA